MDAVWLSRCKTFSKLILQVWLLGLFLHIFGLPAVERYFEKKVIVVTSTVKTESIPLPAITIAVNGVANGNGWKKRGAFRYFVTKHCKHAKTTETLVGCIERETYNFSEISSGVILGLGAPKGHSFAQKSDDIAKDQNWIEDYTHTYFGRIYTLEHSLKLKSSSYMKEDSIRIDLKPDEEKSEFHYYDLFFHDPKYFYLNMNPEPGFPRVHRKVYPEMLPYYYPIALTEIVELPGLPEDPCIEDPDYNFKDCIKDHILGRVGCRTKWDNNNYPLCSTVEDFA